MPKQTLSAVVSCLALVAVAILAPARASPADAKVAGDEPASAEATPSPDAPPPAGEAAAEEIEWLVDENGKKYRVFELEKGIEGRHWMWIGDNQDEIQITYGMRFEVLEHDEDSFSLKKYAREAAPLGPLAPTGPSPEEIEQVAASYRADLEESDRLRFESFDRGLPRVGQWRNGFDIADMNGDGHPDIVFGASRKGFPARPSIYLGDSAGNWRLWRARYPAFPYDYGDAAVADFNGDGHMDLAMAIHLRGLLVLVGDGAGRFRAWSRGIGLEVPGQGGDASTFSSRAIEVADWNGDGRVDLLALGEGPKGLSLRTVEKRDMVSANGPIFFLNNGDGSWRPKGYESTVFGDAVAVGDFDGDGRIDFVTGSNSLGNNRILNLGRGAEDWETRAIGAVRPRAAVRAVAVGRLNDDEIDDLVVGYIGRENKVWRSGVDVLLGGQDLEWQRRPLYSTEGKGGVYGLATGDLDGDGRTDIALATHNGEVHVFLAEEDGFFSWEISPELAEKVPGCRGYGLRLADLNGDGRDEVIVSFAGESSSTLGGTLPGCPQGGSLRAWSPVPRQPQVVPAASGR